MLDFDLIDFYRLRIAADARAIAHMEVADPAGQDDAALATEKSLEELRRHLEEGRETLRGLELARAEQLGSPKP